jgi:transcriptional regulator with XRE-family HTH domain
MANCYPVTDRVPVRHSELAMNVHQSCSPPLRFCPTLDLASDSSAHSLRRPHTSRNLSNVLRSDAQLPRDLRVEPVKCGCLVDFGDCGVKLDGQVELPRREYATHHNAFVHTRQGESVAGRLKMSESLGKKIKDLREKLEMSQQRFALALGIDQGSVSRWERDKIRPLPEQLTRIAKLADDETKLFFLEEAGIPASYFMGDRMLPELRYAASEAVARSLPECNRSRVAKGTFAESETLSAIPYIHEPSKVGTQDAVANPTNVLHLPSSWLPAGGTLRATRFPNPGNPYFHGEIIGLVDISRRDPDRLLGCIVAVETATGVEAMMLRRDGTTYLLLPLNSADGASVKVLKSQGVGSIVGRICKWIGDAPPPDPNRKRYLRRRVRS